MKCNRDGKGRSRASSWPVSKQKEAYYGSAKHQGFTKRLSDGHALKICSRGLSRSSYLQLSVSPWPVTNFENPPMHTLTVLPQSDISDTFLRRSTLKLSLLGTDSQLEWMSTFNVNLALRELGFQPPDFYSSLLQRASPYDSSPLLPPLKNRHCICPCPSLFRLLSLTVHFEGAPSTWTAFLIFFY